MQYGHAVERMVRAEIRRDAMLEALFDPAGIGRRGPDIAGKRMFASLRFEITTSNPRTIAEHLARPYGENLIIITYERPVDLVVLPR
jgi:hypothetical protein